jgi:hypothetical protein
MMSSPGRIAAIVFSQPACSGNPAARTIDINDVDDETALIETRLDARAVITGATNARTNQQIVRSCRNEIMMFPNSYRRWSFFGLIRNAFYGAK